MVISFSQSGQTNTDTTTLPSNLCITDECNQANLKRVLLSYFSFMTGLWAFSFAYFGDPDKIICVRELIPYFSSLVVTVSSTVLDYQGPLPTLNLQQQAFGLTAANAALAMFSVMFGIFDIMDRFKGIQRVLISILLGSIFLGVPMLFFMLHWNGKISKEATAIILGIYWVFVMIGVLNWNRLEWNLRSIGGVIAAIAYLMTFATVLWLPDMLDFSNPLAPLLSLTLTVSVLLFIAMALMRSEKASTKWFVAAMTCEAQTNNQVVPMDIFHVHDDDHLNHHQADRRIRYLTSGVDVDVLAERDDNDRVDQTRQPSGIVVGHSQI
eukprot:c2454_g1_i1.p1 GENE.c2454_g1_i1~~c2454_g1_i1.p1  ORF type:complete len:364 (+),score=88.91 c2454_g1_i1:121-1092(+)